MWDGRKGGADLLSWGLQSAAGEGWGAGGTWHHGPAAPAHLLLVPARVSSWDTLCFRVIYRIIVTRVQSVYTCPHPASSSNILRSLRSVTNLRNQHGHVTVH